MNDMKTHIDFIQSYSIGLYVIMFILNNHSQCYHFPMSFSSIASCINSFHVVHHKADNVPLHPQYKI